MERHSERKQISGRSRGERIAKVIASIAVASLMAGGVAAETASLTPADLTEVELGRDAIELQDHVRPVPVDRDFVDTAVIFTNTGPSTRVAWCVAYNRNGTPVGRFRVKVPRFGLRFVLASDVGNDRDFVGSVACRSRGNLVGSAMLLGLGLTSLPAQQWTDPGHIGIHFPVVATY